MPGEEDRQSEDENGGEVDATDAARRKADEMGVKLSRLNGTGSGGRVLAKDEEKAAKQTMASPLRTAPPHGCHRIYTMLGAPEKEYPT